MYITENFLAAHIGVENILIETETLSPICRDCEHCTIEGKVSNPLVRCDLTALPFLAPIEESEACDWDEEDGLPPGASEALVSCGWGYMHYTCPKIRQLLGVSELDPLAMATNDGAVDAGLSDIYEQFVYAVRTGKALNLRTRQVTETLPPKYLD